VGTVAAGLRQRRHFELGFPSAHPSTSSPDCTLVFS